MTTTKMNLRVSLSRNYNTVEATFLEQEIEFLTKEDFEEQVAKKYAQLTAACNAQLDIISPKRTV